MSWFYSFREEQGYYIYKTKNLKLALVIGLSPVVLLFVLLIVRDRIGASLKALLLAVLAVCVTLALLVLGFSYLPLFFRLVKAGWKGKSASVRRVGLVGREWKIEK